MAYPEAHVEIHIIHLPEVECRGGQISIDLREAARRLGTTTRGSYVIGDSIWDMIAAARCGALGIGLLSGGYGREELERAGALRVYDDPADMLVHLDELAPRPHD